MPSALAFVLLILLLAANAFFVCSEFALVSSRADKLESLLQQGHERAAKVIDASEHLSMMLATCQLGITIASVLLGKIAEPAIAQILEVPLAKIHVEGALLHTISFIIALAIVSFLHILFGEMVPKNLTIAGPEKIALVIVPPTLVLMKISKPLIVFFNFLANSTLRVLFGVTPKDELDNDFSATQLKSMIGESRGMGLIDQEETIRLEKAFKASDRPLSDVMIPLHRIRSIELHNGCVALEELQSAVKETGYSRYPVAASSGRYLGFLHIKDVLDYLLEPHSETIVIPAEVIRPLVTFPHDATISSVSARMRRLHSHLALVVDASTNEPTGFIALEDLMEEFVGTVRDSTHRISE